MNTPIHFFLGALALVVPAAFLGWAGDDPAPPAREKVLLLENERILEGHVERIGEQYRVRRSVGETWVPAGKVVCMCSSHQEAYVHVRARANLHDPDERLRLAHWCQLHGLREQALAEVKAAAQLRPEHPPTQRLLANLQRSAVPDPPAQPTQPDETAEPGPPPPPVDVTQEALGQFVTRVQPILLNACAGCHGPGKGGAFQLVRPHNSETAGRRTLQQNLSAVLGQVNLEQPQTSPLLTKSVSVHGKMSQPPLQGRHAVAYQTLEDWVRRTLAGNPQLRQPSAAANGVPIPAAPVRPVEPPPARPAAAPTEKPEPPATPPAVPAEPPPPGPADPYDPAAFNRQMHPERK